MADTFELEIATPERLLARVTVREAQIPVANGYIGVLPNHSPLLAELGTGALSYTDAGGLPKCLAVSGGWVEVLPDHVRVLADRAEKADEVDAARATAAIERARERLARPEAGEDIGRALNAMKRAQARLAARDKLTPRAPN
jgi:F-type H+-transporting ATPase subunit epsilon